MKRISRLPLLAGGIAVAAVLASFGPTAGSRAFAQAPAYYYPYGQGPYGGYGAGYAGPSRANSNMFPTHGGMFGNRAYGYSGYSGYGRVPSGYGYRLDYGTGPYVRDYGRSSYYQPTYGPVYVPFGYRY